MTVPPKVLADAPAGQAHRGDSALIDAPFTGRGEADQPVSEVTAAELRALAEEKGEPFDGNLTERQARARIDALKEM